MLQKTLLQRLENIRIILHERQLQGLIVSQTPYIYHLTHWLPPVWIEPYLVINEKEMILVSPEYPSGFVPSWTSIIPYQNFDLFEAVSPLDCALEAILEATSQLKLTGKRVGISLETLPAKIFLGLSEKLKLQDARETFLQATIIKDELAIQEIKNRVQMLDKAFAQAQRSIRENRTELEIYAEIYLNISQNLNQPLTLACCLGSGERSVIYEPQPSNKKIARGEVVLLDLFPNLAGYVADYTRNFIVGSPSGAQIRQHAALEKALLAAQSALHPGITASEIDCITRKTIENEGFGDLMYTHHTGHGFGLISPEPPWIIPADQMLLKAGMIVAVEPGIYHPVQGGMRLEGNFLLTEDGNERLDGFPTELVVIP